MWKDEIVEEIHQIRDNYAKSFNYDLNAIFEDLRKKQAESGKEVVTLSRKPGVKSRWSRPYLDGETKENSHPSST
ncbi:hypothetical protein [Lyngbya sp. PCC 8106]|uniref:hypothetical protein n=1 Tax=Lyngbya sp. (strain PCC 8106) TaxID=313612 RepID=UPI0000EABC62|nr:hypothetical protein [Lyngbya sp. PCC 8106]EAW35580.1 hypothetical protein L8106_13255 [Lyngbya sp. PCC 8106]